MELNIGPETSSGCPAARKKRSDFRRRPHPDPKPITKWQHVITLPSSLANFGGNGVGHAIQSPSLASLDDIEPDENPRDGLKKSSLESDGLGIVKKPKKVKLRIGGVTRTLHADSSSGFSQQKQDVFAKESSLPKAICQDSPLISESYNVKMVHKSSRISKKRAVDDGFDDEDDEEIRYLKKLRASRASGYGDRPAESHRKTKGISKIMDITDGDRRDYGSSAFGRAGRKSRIYKDNGYEKELGSDDEIEDKRKMLAEDLDPSTGSGPEMTMTTRKRALETLDSGGHVEFPTGLPDAPSKKQKLSEVEQQLRKAEAAQRRRSQAEKAAKEAEAEAIRRILGQDSSRKKKEEKLKKQQEELAQERTERAATLGPSTVRYIMGPKGTVVIFSEDMGLPKIFDPRPCRYPPPREKCVGPNCTNEYKYRDSKSKLPLCSLNCYKAVQGNTELLPTC